MGVFDNWFSPEAREVLRKREEEARAQGIVSASDAKVAREIRVQQELIQSPALAWKGDGELLGPIPEDYSAAYKAAMGRPFEVKTSVNQPYGSYQDRRLKKILDENEKARKFLEMRRANGIY